MTRQIFSCGPGLLVPPRARPSHAGLLASAHAPPTWRRDEPHSERTCRAVRDVTQRRRARVSPGAGSQGLSLIEPVTYPRDRSSSMGLVERLLRAAGWPSGLVGPILFAYRTSRRLRVAGALGEPFVPTSGTPAGCSIAVDVRAILT